MFQEPTTGFQEQTAGHILGEIVKNVESSKTVKQVKSSSPKKEANLAMKAPQAQRSLKVTGQRKIEESSNLGRLQARGRPKQIFCRHLNWP